MAANQSNLSKYGYDFVVATTQNGINSGLLHYLRKIDAPPTVLCFVADENGAPKQISLDDLKKKSGIDPFDIKKVSDAGVAALRAQRFMVALKLKLGLPPGVAPKDLPPIVNLSAGDAKNVTFNMFCSEFQVIQYTPGGGYASVETWDMWSQPFGEPWYFTTTVNLVYKDLDKELDTPYFNNHPKQQKALRKGLQNLRSGAFSLQQLLFDLDNAAVQSTPNIKGMKNNSNAADVLSKNFVSVYYNSAKEHGEPILCVYAKADAPDRSSFELTAMEREVNQFVGENGTSVDNPTKKQQKVATLNYLCAANHNPLPGHTSFNFNWVDPENVLNQDGVLAVNRNTLAKYFEDKLLPLVKKGCIGVKAGVDCPWDSAVDARVTYSGLFTSGKTPKASTITETGKAMVLSISYDDYSRAHDRAGLTTGENRIWSAYTCEVSFGGNTITIVQHLTITVNIRFDNSSTGKTNIVDQTLTDVYTLSVGQNGTLEISEPKSSHKDAHQTADVGWITEFVTGIKKITDAFEQQTKTFFAKKTITDIPATGLGNFVFPGARVFTYTDVGFSDYQDLVASITYVEPS